MTVLLKNHRGLRYRGYPAHSRFQRMLSLQLGQVFLLAFRIHQQEEHPPSHQIKRIYLSFSNRGTKTLASLETHNRKLRELLESSDKLDKVKVGRKDTNWGSIFECIRQHATNLRTAIKSGWNCDCKVPHPASLRLQKHTTPGSTSTFQVSFAIPKGPRKPPDLRREVAISVNPERMNNESSSVKIKDQNSADQEDYLITLQHNFGASPGSETGVPSHLSSITSSSLSSTHSRSSFREYFTRNDQKRSSSISTTNMVDFVTDENGYNYVQYLLGAFTVT